MGKKKHDGHHGGAWKVAYADFVTAMMALFMVLWIVSQKEEVVQSVTDYFRDPLHSASKFNSFITDKKNVKNVQDGEESHIDMEELNRLADEIYQNLKIQDNDADKPIEIVATEDGLKIFIYDLDEKPFFKENSSTLSEWGDFALYTLAWLLDKKPYNVSIDAYHPQISKNFREEAQRLRKDKNTFTSWDLCVSRAQITYRSLVYYGFTLKKIENVAGSLALHKEAKHDTNQVITLTLTTPNDILINRTNG